MTTRLLLLSTTVQNWQSLAQTVTPDTQVLTIDPENDTLTEILARIDAQVGESTFERIAIASHGDGGMMELSSDGALTLTTVNASAQQQFWQELGTYLDPRGEIDLLACSLAGNEEGSRLLMELHALTQHQVNASIDLTGNDGNWYLEYGQVNVENIWFDAQALEQIVTQLDSPDSAPEFQVNTYEASSQMRPTVTSLSDGGWLIAWQSYGQDGSSYGIYAQRYDCDGFTVGGEFAVNFSTEESQYTPDLTALSDGGWLAVWTSHDQDGSDGGIYAQRYAADGSRVGDETPVNTQVTGSQSSASVTSLSDGGWLVVWQSETQDQGTDIFAQRYAAEGSLVGEEFQINLSTTGDQEVPSVTSLADGGWLVAWESSSPDYADSDIFAQRYAADGSLVGEEFQVNAYSQSWQSFPSVTSVVDGGWLVAWQSYGQDGSDQGIYVRRYAADGSAVGEEFRVNNYTTSAQSYPSISSLADDGWLVTWQSDGQDGSDYGVYAQRYAADGSVVGDAYQVNSYTNGDQEIAGLTSLPDGGWLITWHSYGQDGSDYGVYAQRYDANGNQVASGDEINHAPQANNDSVEIIRGFAVSIDVLYNDTDIDADSLSIIRTTDPSHGSVSITEDNQLLYTPQTGYSGTDILTYTISDGNGGVDTANVDVFIGYSEQYYLSNNPDVAAAVIADDFDNGWHHYINYGYIEGRSFAIPEGYGDFSEEFYLLNNPDVAAAVEAGIFINGWEHYSCCGQSEGRSYTAPEGYGDFSEEFYLLNNPDVAAAVEAGYLSSGWYHYINFGEAEGRFYDEPEGYGDFSEEFYLVNNSDVAAAVSAGFFTSGWEHYINFGQSEGRSYAEPEEYGDFNEALYLLNNPDVAAAVESEALINGWEHYVKYGQTEGRSYSVPEQLVQGLLNTTEGILAYQIINDAQISYMEEDHDLGLLGVTDDLQDDLGF